ncbi:hypothetical protein CVM73_37645 [Bradyrhizobium forestalis]|uniref:Uncharacterized protein n=1 Tax=Bradyrhizobium forestalis TaxID=1419263 RepID=A0A2M8QXD1_9BRAD|nr:hypothetical protein CVM73_37645 [Bradyrhizobium forestalis]
MAVWLDDPRQMDRKSADVILVLRDEVRAGIRDVVAGGGAGGCAQPAVGDWRSEDVRRAINIGIDGDHNGFAPI